MIHDLAIWGMVVSGIWAAWSCWKPNLVGMVVGAGLFGVCYWTWAFTG